MSDNIQQEETDHTKWQEGPHPNCLATVSKSQTGQLFCVLQITVNGSVGGFFGLSSAIVFRLPRIFKIIHLTSCHPFMICFL